MWILLLSHSLFAQNTGISGRVTDEAGMPIIGVSVFEKGTNKGTITNNEGNFRLNITGEATLKVSYVGYITQEISVSAGSNTQIVLKENNKSLDEVVVVGYGTVKKKRSHRVGWLC